MYSGEYSRRLHPLRGVACSTAELRKGASPSRRIRTSDLAIIDAADLFTTGEQVWSARMRGDGSRWGTGDFGGSPVETRSPSREALATRDAPALAEPIPRHDRTEAGFEPAFHCCEVSEIFTTSVRSLFRRGEKPRRRGSPGGTVESPSARGPSLGVEVTRPVTTRDRSRPGFSFRGKGRTSTAPKGLRCQTKERGSSPPGTVRRAFAALASGGTAEFRWPEAFDIQRSNETRHHPE